jgi:hypothetical protein
MPHTTQVSKSRVDIYSNHEHPTQRASLQSTSHRGSTAILIGICSQWTHVGE